MTKWNMCATKSETRSFRLHLVICDLEGLSMADIPNNDRYTIKVQVEWAVPRKKCVTSNHFISSDGCVQWNEGIDHVSKLKLKDSNSFSSQMITLEVHGFGVKSKTRASVLAKLSMDIAKFAGQREALGRIIKFPVTCSIGGSTLDARLTVKLNSLEFQPLHRNSTVHPLSPIQLLPSLSSCIRHHKQTSNEMVNSSSDSDEEAEPIYRTLIATNLLLGSFVHEKLEFRKEDNWEVNQQYESVQKPSLIRLLTLKNLRVGPRVPDHPRDTPLLNKASGEDGGDDTNNDHHCHSSPSQPEHVKVQCDFQHSGLLGSDRFVIGSWEKRKFISRDRSSELVTEMFLASIDQRSEKASGGGACTVLAAVIADWLHQNPGILPLRCQFDKLIREGSKEWRNLCKKGANGEKFSDQHFDLDTVLQAHVRPLKVEHEKSYVGFFELEKPTNELELLQGAMSFDSIWEEILRSESRLVEEIYIVSWNDHFFVLKIEPDAIYIIDTLGERLCEGCDKAYILKFNEESTLYKMQPKVDPRKAVDDQSSKAGRKVDKRSCQEIEVCKGRSSCKDYIKRFLAAIPLRELQTDIQKEIVGEAPLHRLLQIEFQFTTPCNNTTNHEAY